MTITWQGADGTSFPRRLLLADLSPELISFICNGCGPKKPSLGESLSLYLRIIRSIRPPQWHSAASCSQHDLDYKVGGASADRRAADKELRSNMLRDAATRPWWQQPWYRGQAWTYWTFVRIFGRTMFHYGTKRTLADLINLYQAQIRAPHG